jgi:hypothetical protein
MGTSSEHPPHQELVDFGLGILGPDQTSQIEQHLDDCNECHDTLLNLADDTFTELVRSLPEPAEEPAVTSEKNTEPKTESGSPVNHRQTNRRHSGRKSVQPRSDNHRAIGRAD